MYNELKLLVLNDNVGRLGLLNEWGWSVYVEAGEHKILFDADTSPNVIRYNSKKLGVRLENIRWAFLSHHHRDHSGGLEYVASIKPGLTIYVPPSDTSYLYKLGLKPVVIDKPAELAPSIWSTGPLKGMYRSYSLWEHGLVIRTRQGSVLIVGCSHPGIDVFVEKAREISGDELFLVIGGYHMPSPDEIDRLAKQTRFIAPTHCSGDSAKAYTRIKYGEKYVSVRTGTMIMISGGELSISY